MEAPLEERLAVLRSQAADLARAGWVRCFHLEQHRLIDLTIADAIKMALAGQVSLDETADSECEQLYGLRSRRGRPPTTEDWGGRAKIYRLGGKSGPAVEDTASDESQ